MPLYPNAVDLIRVNLEQVSCGLKPRGVLIGVLTSQQLEDINFLRASHATPLPAIIPEILFYGKHLYKSRVLRDGYTIADVIDQMLSALDESSIFIPNPKMTVLQNKIGRADRYGNIVQDLAVLECTTRHPRPELFSVMPKGDRIKPVK